ncbi:uncharacterized protein LOC111628378 [Centruroides sculpturatus]|uniref:uncharacterized protein LOC111628378 n=1 Tax=Centruroides sculpturatus TaxID=218467 RepID=UPI000C6E4659|nr:uncharacterized protein LOC111628378 [Centruroides sculpturatus]
MNKLLFTFVVIGIILLESGEGRYAKIEGRDRFNLKRRNSRGSVADVDNINVDRNAAVLGTQGISPDSVTGDGPASAVIGSFGGLGSTLGGASGGVGGVGSGLGGVMGRALRKENISKRLKEALSRFHK